MLNMPSTAKMTIILALVLTVAAASLLMAASQPLQIFTLRKAVDSPLKKPKVINFVTNFTWRGYTFLYIKMPVPYFLFLKFFFLCKYLNIIFTYYDKLLYPLF